jgi:hypothetical protein
MQQLLIAGQKAISGTKKDYMSDVSFLCHSHRPEKGTSM